MTVLSAHPGLDGTATRARDAARSAGLAAGLRVVVGSGVAVPCSPAGTTLLPADCAADAAGWRLGDSVLLPGTVTVTSSPHPLGSPESIETVHVAAAAPAATAAAGPARPPEAAFLLLAVRHGLTARMLAAAVDHLSGRRSSGRPLLDRQLLRGAIADAVATLEFCRDALPGVPVPPAALAEVRSRLDALDWSLITMFGAAGYVRGHQARCLYLAHLIDDVWIGPGPDAPGEGQAPAADRACVADRAGGR